MPRFFLLLFALACLFACRNQSASTSANTPAQADQTTQTTDQHLPTDFLDFYEKFHTDSLYQIEHISWPLQGDESVEIDSVKQAKRATTWEPENWIMHRPVDFSSGEFKRQWELLGDGLIIERISYAAANYGLERRFVKQYNDEWELVFYSDMQEMKK